MEFTVEFYETDAGRCPVQEFLDELKASDLGDFAAVMAGLAKLRHVGKLNTRVMWFFMKGRRIVAVHGIRNKGQAIPARDLDTAQERMRDWLKRQTK